MTENLANSVFGRKLRQDIRGGVHFDAFSRARYATDASAYQCFPAVVVFPQNYDEVRAAMTLAEEAGMPVTARGGGTSTGGQALGEGLVLDFSRHMNKLLFYDRNSGTCAVEPGITLEALNAQLQAHKVFFPVEIASGGTATIGGMLANGAIGLRALRYGTMGDNTLAADVLLAGGVPAVFGDVADELADAATMPPGLWRLMALSEQVSAADAPSQGTPFQPPYRLPIRKDNRHISLLPVLAGSEGTLAITTRLELKLVARVKSRATGFCRFASVHAALKAVSSIIPLNPCAVELVDVHLVRMMGLEVEREAALARLFQGDTPAALIVEFDERNAVENSRLLKNLAEVLRSLGHKEPPMEILGRGVQASLWRLHRRGLQRLMAAGSPTGLFAATESVQLPLGGLPAYAASLDALLRELNVPAAFSGSVGYGCLSVRSISHPDRSLTAAQSTQAAAAVAGLIRRHGGVAGAGYGYGLSRPELLPPPGSPASGLRLEIKSLLDPRGHLNPGKLVDAPRSGDRALFRTTIAATEPEPPLEPLDPEPFRLPDFAGRCTGLSVCRNLSIPNACPSYLITGEEQHSPRGRANSVRLALSGQLGHEAEAGEAIMDCMRLCVSCKACRTACPNGIDIPRMKAVMREGQTLGPAEKLYTALPLRSHALTRWRHVVNLRDKLPGLPRLSERRLGLSADRPWPPVRRMRPLGAGLTKASPPPAQAAFFLDTFNRLFEPAVFRAGAIVLDSLGYSAVPLTGGDDAQRPLCCGRPWYDMGRLDEARREATRVLAAMRPYREAGMPVVGFEPLCVLMMRDEYASLGLTVPEAQTPLLFEEFVQNHASETNALPLKAMEAALMVKPHCHQHWHGNAGLAAKVLSHIPGLDITDLPQGCCGLNGLFGYTPDTMDASFAMAELALFPALRKTARDTLIAAPGFFCRQQIRDGLGRTVNHPAVVLQLALRADAEIAA